MGDNLPTLQGQTSIESYANNFETKMNMCRMLMQTGMVPSHFKTPAHVLGAVLYGQEIGLSPMIALRYIQVIQGQPTINAAGLQGLAQKAGGKIKILEHTDKLCKVQITRGDLTNSYQFTIEQAREMGLVSKDNWRKMPKQMLYARCVSEGVRSMFQDVIGGLYSSEEMRDTVTAEKPPQRVVEPEVLPHDPMPDWDNEPPKAKAEIKDWVDYEYRYHLPVKKAGKDMAAVRKWCKEHGFRFNEDDKHWYSDLFVEKLKDYIRPLEQIEDIEHTEPEETTTGTIDPETGEIDFGDVLEQRNI